MEHKIHFKLEIDGYSLPRPPVVASRCHLAEHPGRVCGLDDNMLVVTFRSRQSKNESFDCTVLNRTWVNLARHKTLRNFNCESEIIM